MNQKYKIHRFKYKYIVVALIIFNLLSNFFIINNKQISILLLNSYLSILKEQLGIKSPIWDNISQLQPILFQRAMNIIFPNVATDPKKTEKSFFYDKNKSIKKEYKDIHQNWPDDSFILDPPDHQKIGPDVIPGIKDVMHLIYKHQFPQTCKGKKFITADHLFNGFGATIHTLGAILGQAIIEDKIFIYTNFSFLWEKGPYCGDQYDRYISKYINLTEKRSHTKIKRNYSYYQNGKKPFGFDCFFMPISNCSIEDANLNDIKVVNQLNDNHIIPPIIVPIMENLKIPDDLSYFYWRLCASAFLYRPNKLFKKLVKEIETDYLVNPVDHYDVSIHVRHGDKIVEMKLVYGKDCLGALKIIKMLLNKNKLNIFLSTDDQRIINWFVKNTNESITYFDFHLGNYNFEQAHKLGSILVAQMLANMKHSLFSTYVIGTISSNWNRLIIELRDTLAGYANNYYFEIGDHSCISVEHCKILKKRFDMNW